MSHGAERAEGCAVECAANRTASYSVPARHIRGRRPRRASTRTVALLAAGQPYSPPSIRSSTLRVAAMAASTSSWASSIFFCT